MSEKMHKLTLSLWMTTEQIEAEGATFEGFDPRDSGGLEMINKEIREDIGDKAERALLEYEEVQDGN